MLARRDALRQQATVLGLVVRTLKGIVDDEAGEARDTGDTVNRTLEILSDRRDSTETYRKTAAAMRSETLKLRLSNARTQRAALDVRPKLDKLIALREGAQRALEAASAEVRADNMDAEELAALRTVRQAGGGCWCWRASPA